MREVVLLVGVPGVGKSWVTNQLGDTFDQCLNDEHIGKDYPGALIRESGRPGDKPVLGEVPFSMSTVMDPLKNARRRVTTVFIVEDDRVLTDRYFKRAVKNNSERRAIPPGHLSRQKTYAQRAKESGSFVGTSEQVLAHLKSKWGKS